MNRQMRDLIDSRLSVLQIDKDKMQNIILGTTQKRSGFKQWKMAAAAACLVLVLSLTAIAAGLGYFDLFFEEKAVLISNGITEIGKSVENNGIIFTIDSAYTTEAGGYITATFKKADGSDFGREPHDGSPIFIYDFQAYCKVAFTFNDVQEKVNMPVASSVILSENNKILYMLIPLKRPLGSNTLEGEELTVHIDFLKGPRKGATYEGPWEVKVTMPKIDENKNFTINFTTDVNYYKPDEPYKTVVIDSISLSPTGYILKGSGDEEAIRAIAYSMKIELTDGSCYDFVSSGSSSGIADGKIVCYGLFKKPINISEIDCIYLNETKIPLN